MPRIVGWGFELIKHDFSSFDISGKWGHEYGAEPGASGPLADPTVTTAEALVHLHTRIHRGAGDAVILGCNVVGHLAAGLMHANRGGDDNSGQAWDRTRKMAINTLAFQGAHHGALFTLDADCVPSTMHTDWAKNRQLLHLLAASGAALFVSLDPSTRSATVDDDMHTALQLSLDGGAEGGVEPLDWHNDPAPSRWRVGASEESFHWLERQGADPF